MERNLLRAIFKALRVFCQSARAEISNTKAVKIQKYFILASITRLFKNFRPMAPMEREEIFLQFLLKRGKNYEIKIQKH